MLCRQSTFFLSMANENQTAQPEQLHKNSDHVHASPGDKLQPQHADPGGIPLEHRLMTKAQVAAYFGITERTVENWMAQRLLPHRKVGRTVRFMFSDLLDALDTRFKVSRRP